MIHIMKLKSQYFDWIKYGTKEYEVRLNDEKRRNIKRGDFIEFQKEPYLEEKIIVRVEDLLYYSSFNELLDKIDIKLLADACIQRKKLKTDLEKIYTVEQQNKYGVVAIKLRKKIIVSSSNINNLSYTDNIFNTLKDNYSDFNRWLNKMKLNGAYVYYTEKNNEITSIMMLKLNETDSQQFLEKGNILKIRTFLVIDKNKGIGRFYLNMIDDISYKNSIDYIYLTIKINNKELINFMEKNGYVKYNQYNDEFVYYKELV